MGEDRHVPDNEMSEIQQKATHALAAAVQAAGQLASVLIEARIEQLRRAAGAGEQAARQARAQARAWHTADATVWREAAGPGWWRAAGAEDIATAWRAAATWRHVDPRAEAACRTMAERLAERGVHVDQ